MSTVIAAQPVGDAVRLLCLCARTDAEPSSVIEAARSLQSEEEWRRLVQIARFHGVEPLIYRSVERSCPEALTPALGGALRKSFHAIGARNLALTQELHKVGELLRLADVPMIPFKGVTLAQGAYRSLGLRPCSDLDLLVPPRMFERAEAALLAGGYVHVPSKGKLKGQRKALDLYLSQQLTFVLRERATVLDVHTRVVPPGYYFAPGFDELLHRSTTLTVGGFPFRSLVAEDLLLVLCLHGVKNRWEVLKHYCDVAELLRASPDLDWDTVLRRARSTRAERILAVGLYLAHRTLAAPLPDPIRNQVSSDVRVRALSEHVLESMRRTTDARMPRASRMKLHIGIQDTVRTKARYCMYAILRLAYHGGAAGT